MKLTVLGGGGVRSPMLARSIANRAGAQGIDAITFMDNDDAKLKLYGGMARRIASMIEPGLKFTLTSDPVAAVKDADYVITTLRVGGDLGRIKDERIALELGVLGQETTGAGGFAMAMRSIPALSRYCALIQTHAKPGAPIFNFTNPSGLVTQALRDSGFKTVYGICDGPSEFIKELGHFLGADPETLDVKCYGLNHLSWFESVKLGGKEQIDRLIDDPALYSKTEMRFFDRELLRELRLLPSGYLYYYYCREKALANIKASAKTRGETIKEINEAMADELGGMDGERDFDKAIQIYLRFHAMRENSYMAIESGKPRGDTKKIELDLGVKGVDDGGYAGVALNFIGALNGGKPCQMILSVPNEGNLEGLRDSDIIEVTCRVDSRGATPEPIGQIPEIPMALISQVKLYERLAVDAIRNRSLTTAAKALMVHPLINSWTLGRALVQGYAAAHQAHVGKWT